MVTPCIVPGIHAKPVVYAVLVAPADSFYRVAAKCTAGLMLINSTLVGQEIFVDGESRSDCAILEDVLLDIFNFIEQKSIAIRGITFIFLEIDRGVGMTYVVAFGLLFRYVTALRKSWRRDVMSAFWHRICIAPFFVAVLTTRDNARVYEPVPWSAHLTTVTAH